MAAAALSAQSEAPKTVNVVTLEDDKDNATVSAPAELGQKVPTVSVDADVITKKAAEAQSEPEAKVRDEDVKSLTIEGTVIPPSADLVKTLEEAVRNILVQAGKQIGTVSTNGVEKLTMPYQQLGDGKSYEVEWRKALRLMLSPVGYNFTEDGELVLFGLTEEVDVKHKQLAQERLTSNRTPILFTTNDTEGGMDLRSAIRDVAIKAGVTISTDYMDQKDLYAPAQTTAGGALTAEDIGKAKEKATVQQVVVKRTSFDTNGQQTEWRTVLKAILDPNGYGFIEEEGIVKIAKKEVLEKWSQDAVAKRPLSAKVIRLYHADPESVVERVMKIKGLLKHPNASLQATRKKDDNTDVVKNLNARIQTSSGQRSGMSDTTAQVFDKLVRPRTVPAIIAYDIEENMEDIEKAIRLFDIKEKQILIEAIIFQLSNDNAENPDYDGDGNADGEISGIRWEGFENFVPLYGAVRNSASIATSVARWSASKATESNREGGFDVQHGRNAWVRTDGFDFNTMIQLIRKYKNTKLLSSPMLVVGDHSEAAIQVSRVDPVPDPDSNFSDITAGVSRETFSLDWLMIRSGILMWVSPEITENGTSVRLTVHPQVVQKEEPPVVFPYVDSQGNQNNYFNYALNMHEMDTRATVPSGATLMFGGLTDNAETEKETKVRWLGDIPLIGWFFRSKETVLEQRNLIIMIRPTILEDDDETGFEKNALKESESVMENSGRDLRKPPNGPYSVMEVKEKAMELIDERVIQPFKIPPEEAGSRE